MKIYGNLDITGNLKVRNVINDKVVTEGGFYSGQFGEVAYKSEIPDPSAVGSNFYGMVIKYPNNSVSYRDIDTVTLGEDSFYLYQRAANADEVQVSLRNASNTFNTIIATDIAQRVVRAAAITTLSSLTIPANRLAVGNMVRIRRFFKIQNGSGATRTPVWTFALNGSTQWDDQLTNLVANNTHFLCAIDEYIAIRSATSAFWIAQNKWADNTAQSVGYGLIDGTNAVNGMMGNSNVTVNLTVANTFDFRVHWTAANTQSISHIYSYAELVP